MDLLFLGKDPIAPDQPTGSDVRYSPEFEALQAEMDKLSLPRAIGTLDWEKVADQAAEILARKSKDLLVASYLANVDRSILVGPLFSTEGSAFDRLGDLI